MPGKLQIYCLFKTIQPVCRQAVSPNKPKTKIMNQTFSRIIKPSDSLDWIVMM